MTLEYDDKGSNSSSTQEEVVSATLPRGERVDEHEALTTRSLKISGKPKGEMGWHDLLDSVKEELTQLAKIQDGLVAWVGRTFVSLDGALRAAHEGGTATPVKHLAFALNNLMYGRQLSTGMYEEARQQGNIEGMRVNQGLMTTMAHLEKCVDKLIDYLNADDPKPVDGLAPAYDELRKAANVTLQIRANDQV